ncbi:hypothetical protein [Bergeyella sp. RCAD1439]|uniref:hypothetical protein n=1 Tax=Bergeyella anatis TaxID=3113737 RepID=UPI002E17E868|nr:hypothetical protein [Bergeyella sp. RCAD1439]
MRVLKIQEAQLLLKKILAKPKLYHLVVDNEGVKGCDDEVAFRLRREGERGVFEVTIDEYTFTNNTGEWHNAIIMLENTVRKIEREKEQECIDGALEKLRRYLEKE